MTTSKQNCKTKVTLSSEVFSNLIANAPCLCGKHIVKEKYVTSCAATVESRRGWRVAEGQETNIQQMRTASSGLKCWGWGYCLN